MTKRRGGANKSCLSRVSELTRARLYAILHAFHSDFIIMAASKKHEVTVSARAQFIADQSDPKHPVHPRYIFAYTISIENTGTVAVQLISRYWHIVDANAEVQEVRGLGVVGQQPLLQPGEKFEYTSGCQLNTAVGTMHGRFQMVAEDGSPFEVEVAAFTLSIPRVLH